MVAQDLQAAIPVSASGIFRSIVAPIRWPLLTPLSVSGLLVGAVVFIDFQFLLLPVRFTLSLARGVTAVALISTCSRAGDLFFAAVEANERLAHKVTSLPRNPSGKGRQTKK